MKIKNKLILFTSSILPIVAFTSLSSTNQLKEVSDNSLLQTSKNANYDEKWVSSIKESSESDNIKLFFNREASLAYQQAVLVAEYMLLDNLKNGSNSKDDILFFYNYDTYANNKWGAKEWENNWNQKLVEGGVKSSFKFVNNTNKLDSNFNTDYSQYPTTPLISDILNHYNKISQDYKFDLWIVDGGLKDLWNKNTDIETNYKFIKHINKIYVITDGNYQTYTFMGDVLNTYNQQYYQQLTVDQVETKFNQYRTDPDKTYIDDFKNYTLYDFIHDPNIFTFFHTEKYTDSPYYQKKLVNKAQLYNSYPMNYNYYGFVKENIAANYQQQFIDDYEKFFLIYGKNSLLDFIDINKNSYDPKKKNVIWLGDSLITDKTHVYPERQKEMQGMMKAWLKMFPKEEYNLIAKHHPRYSQTQQVELTRWTINSNDDSFISYFSNVPWEIFLSWNYKMEETNQSYTGFFNKKDETTFFGYQYTTTTIQTTAFFLKNVYDYTNEDLSKTLDSYNFPITETFDVVNRQSSFYQSREAFIEGNKEKIANIYDPFVESNTYPDYKTNQVTSSVFLKNNGISLDDNNNDLTLIITLSVLVPVVIISIGLLTYFLIKKKNSKKYRRLVIKKKR